MSSNATALVKKLWNNCNILRHDGLYYVEQLTLLLFLKMTEEALARSHRKPPFNKPSPMPKGIVWRVKSFCDHA